MASATGPRAVGTDGRDHKFRQRVDDHYKLMAEAKRSARASARLQLGAAVGFAALAGPLATRATETTLMLALTSAAALLSLASGAAWKAALGATGSQQVEKRAEAYAGWNRNLGFLIIAAAAATASTKFLLTEDEEVPLFVFRAGSVVALGDLVGCIMGGRAASKLLAAFEMQRAKGKTK